jgi:hypothetical protein
MFQLSQIGELGFPACVSNGCRDYDGTNIASVWASPTHASLSVKSVPHAKQAAVMSQCPELLDEMSDEEEQPQIELLAYALHFTGSHEVVVVTEDVLDLPYRSSITSAAHSIGIRALTLDGFAQLYGL